MAIHMPSETLLRHAMARHATLPALVYPVEASQWCVYTDPSSLLIRHAMPCHAMPRNATPCHATLKRLGAARTGLLSKSFAMARF